MVPTGFRVRRRIYRSLAGRRHASDCHFLVRSASDGGSHSQRSKLLSRNSVDVVYVHGLWMSGGESLFLRRRLANEFGLQVHPFRYSAALSTMTEITARLQGFVESLGSPKVHFVGHSLGGLVIYRLFERFPKQPPGRAVFMGTPSVASKVAEQASHIRLVASLMGQPV